jgi:PIN domain nuclease of toxin-antitoxin system
MGSNFMILLDTHAWIWWAASSPNLSKRAAKYINSADAIYISAISCWEVAMLVAKDRLVLDRDVEVWIDQALKLPRVRLVPLTPQIAVRSSKLDKTFTGDPADRIIVATALEYGYPIVSKDERIKKYSKVRVIW